MRTGWIFQGGTWTSSLSVSSRYLTLFPSFAFGRYFPDQIGVYLNLPLGPGRTLQRRAMCMTDGVELNDTEAAHLMELWGKVHREDHEMCVRLQRGRQSGAAQTGGFLSPYWEDSVRSFQHLVQSAVNEAWRYFCFRKNFLDLYW